MSEPTLEEDVDPACANCGEPIVGGPDRRTVTWVDGGTARHRHFCGDDCLEDWDG